MRLPTKRSEAKTGALRKEGQVRKGPRSRRDRNNWTRERLDYKALEAAKILVDSILYKEIPVSAKSPKGYRRDLRISVLPWSRSGYIDIRFYINGNSTGQGVLVHLDHLDKLVAGVLAASRLVTNLRDKGIIDGPPESQAGP